MSGSLVVGVLEVGGLICGVPIEVVRFEVMAACRARVGVPTIARTASLLFGLKSFRSLAGSVGPAWLAARSGWIIDGGSRR